MGHQVHVWFADTDQPAAVREDLSALLDSAERRRAESMHDAVLRSQFIVAHGAARRIVSGYLGMDARELVWRHGEHGKPEPAQAGHRLRFSMSASSNLAVIAASLPPSATPGAEARDVGVDVERIVSDRQAIRLAARYFPHAQARRVAAARLPGEPASRFATLWTRKEACVKARGGRLVQGLDLAVDGPAPLVVRFPADPSSSAQGEYRVCGVPSPTGFLAAVALTGTAPFELINRVWNPGSGTASAVAARTSSPYPLAP